MPFVVLLLILAGAAVFQVLVSAGLPPVVASHFGAGGNADGFMAREAYVRLMLLFTVGLPLLIAGALGLGRFLPVAWINLPHRDYWLAPERIEQTRRYLARHGTVFAAFLAVFLCFVNWLVVEANRAQPARLDEPPFIAGLVVFTGVTLAWSAMFLLHFRKPRG